MPILLQGSLVHVVQWSIDLNDFPAHHALHRREFPNTPIVDAQGDALVARSFAEDDIAPFVRAVCTWGNYAGIADRVLRDNTKEEIVGAFRDALGNFDPCDPRASLAAITKLRSLGISFASKHLRFLTKGRAVVFDSIISERLGYPLTEQGYRAFSDDCRTLQEALQAQGDPSFEWRLCDVEMAIYARLRKLEIVRP